MSPPSCPAASGLISMLPPLRISDALSARVTLLPRKSFQLRPDLTAKEDVESFGVGAAVSPDYAVDIHTRTDTLPPPSARTGPTKNTSHVRALNLVQLTLRRYQLTFRMLMVCFRCIDNFTTRRANSGDSTVESVLHVVNHGLGLL